MSISNSYPTQTPLLNLNFATGSDQFLDSRISYSRSSTGTYLSNEKALSSENLLPYSNDLSQSAWTKSRVTVASTNNTAPDSSSTASSLLETTDTDSHTFYDNFNCISGQQYSFVYYFKANGRTKVSISPQATATIATVQYDLTAVTSTVLSGSADSHSITAIGSGGFYKCVVTVTATATGTGYSQVNLRDASGNSSYTGDVTKGMFVWGASVSSTGQTVVNQTSGSIHREFAPLLKTAAADEPRFEYAADGQSVGSGTAKGLLIEAQATSLITYSEDFSNSFWDKTRLSIDSNVAVAPDGSLTASAMRVDGTAASTHRMRFSYATGGATPQTFSIFAKAGSKSWVALRFDSSGGAFTGSIAYFNLSNGTTGTVDSGITATINDCGNGWYRCSITRTALASATGQIELYVAEADNDSTIDGNSYDYVLAWGAMVEANTSAPSSYIKSNSGSSTSRAADSCSVAVSQLGLTSSQDVTLLVEGDYGDPTASANTRFAVALGKDSQSYISLYNGNGESGSGYIRTNAPTEFYNASGVTSGNFKAAISAKNNSVKYAADGTSFAEDTDAELPEYTSLKIGGQFNGTAMNGTISRVALYGQALSSTELAALTS